jgi:hypothetical protein
MARAVGGRLSGRDCDISQRACCLAQGCIALAKLCCVPLLPCHSFMSTPREIGTLIVVILKAVRLFHAPHSNLASHSFLLARIIYPTKGSTPLYANSRVEFIQPLTGTSENRILIASSQSTARSNEPRLSSGVDSILNGTKRFDSRSTRMIWKGRTMARTVPLHPHPQKMARRASKEAAL